MRLKTFPTLSITMLLLLVLLLPASRGEERTTTGTLVLDHEVDIERFTYNNGREKLVRTQCVALKRIRQSGTTGSSYAASIVEMEVIKAEIGSFFVEGYIRGTANNNHPYAVVEDRVIPTKASQRHQWKIDQYSSELNPLSRADIAAGEKGKIATSATSVNSDGSPRWHVAYSGWKKHIIKNNTQSPIARENGIVEFHFPGWGNATASMTASQASSSSWLKGHLDPFASAVAKAPRHPTKVYEVTADTNMSKTNTGRSGGISSFTDDSSSGKAEDNFVGETLPKKSKPITCPSCSQVVSRELEHKRTCLYTRYLDGAEYGAAYGCGNTYWICQDWDAHKVSEKCNDGCYAIRYRPCIGHNCPNSRGNTNGNTVSNNGGTTGDGDSSSRCQRGRYCDIGASSASSATAHQVTCGQGHTYWVCNIWTRQEHQSHVTTSSRGGSDTRVACGNAGSNRNRNCNQGGTASSTYAHQTTCGRGHTYWSCSRAQSSYHGRH